MLRDLSHLERADVVRRIQTLTASELHPSQRIQTAQRWSVRFLAVCCLALIPWTTGLAMSLPGHYIAGHWRLAWAGFDVALLGCLAITAWGLRKRRQIVVPASMITSVLLLCDAWFDLLTANGHRDLILSAASALFAELPLAALLCLLSVRALRMAARAARGLEPNAPIPPLWRAPLITLPGHAEIEPWASVSRPSPTSTNGDTEGWSSAWADTAQKVESIGSECLAKVTTSAPEIHLCASECWRTAGFFLDGSDNRLIPAWTRHRECFRSAVNSLLGVSCETATVSFENGASPGTEKSTSVEFNNC